MPPLSLLNTIYLFGAIGAFGLFAVTLFVVSLLSNIKR